MKSSHRKSANSGGGSQPTNRREQIQLTLQWLDNNYILCEGVCLPRCILYAHYLDFCRQKNLVPACAATFGKTIRQKFPELTTRRLGTRGHSKYHYYGIAIRESSAYYHTVYSGKGLTRFSGSRLRDDESISRRVSLTAKTGTLLPEFPNPKYLDFEDDIDVTKVETFLVMYKTHCQCILDTAINANYDEIGHFLVHFWHGMPKHLLILFEFKEVVDVICICDSILYKVLTDVLVPVTLRDVSESSLSEVRSFVKNLEPWMTQALETTADLLKGKKLHVLRRFAQSVKRQTSFLHLAQTSRAVLTNPRQTCQLLTELEKVDIKSIEAQALYTTSDCERSQTDLHDGYLGELKELLQEEASVEAYIEWLESIVQNQVIIQSDNSTPFELKNRAQEFLLSWSFFGARVMHNLTLNNSKTFGSFHLIRMLLDEYILLILESQFYKNEEDELQDKIDQMWRETGSNKSESPNVTEVITKTKFGPLPPGKRLAILNKVKRNGDEKRPKRRTVSTLSKNNVNGEAVNIDKPLAESSLPYLENYSPSFFFGENEACHQGSMALTPPISPVVPFPYAATNSNTQHSDPLEIYVSSAEILVDQHFRNSGFGHFLNEDDITRLKDNIATTVQDVQFYHNNGYNTMPTHRTPYNSDPFPLTNQGPIYTLNSYDPDLYYGASNATSLHQSRVTPVPFQRSTAPNTSPIESLTSQFLTPSEVGTAMEPYGQHHDSFLASLSPALPSINSLLQNSVGKC